MCCLRTFVAAMLGSIALLVSSASAYAADMAVSDAGIFSLIGEIKNGDAERMAVAMSKRRLIGLEIDSLGGDVVEAMRMSTLIKGMHIYVAVADGKICASSCFFLFLAGEDRTATGVNVTVNSKSQYRRDNISGVVGVHRPYLALQDGNQTSMKKQEDIVHGVKRYLVDEGVPQHLIDEMMSRPSNDIYWLKENDLRQIGNYNPGIEEALIAKCGYKRPSQMTTEGWSDERVKKLASCVSIFWIKNRLPLQDIFAEKLRSGWRPWK